jgi:hypothetical protein
MSVIPLGLRRPDEWLLTAGADEIGFRAGGRAIRPSRPAVPGRPPDLQRAVGRESAGAGLVRERLGPAV